MTVRKLQTSIATQKRSVLADIPTKVFIEREGKYPTYYTDADIERLLYGYNGATNFIELFHCLPEIFTPVHQIASRVADAIFTLRRTYNDEPIYKDETFNRLFSKPNPYMNFRQLVYQAVVYRILTGRSFQFFNTSVVLGDGMESILTWGNIPADKVKVIQKKTDPYTATEQSDFVQRYEIPSPNEAGKVRVFDPEKVVPMVNFSMRNPYDMNKADSFLIGAEKAIKNLIPVYEARGAIYIKRGALGFIVSAKKDAGGTDSLTPLEKAELEHTHQKDYGVVGGKSTLAVSSQPIDYKQTGMSIEELQPFDETLLDAVAIYGVLRVPRHLVPTKDASTYANADADLKSFYEDVIIPMAQEFCDSWTNFMKLRENRKYIFPDFSHIGVLQDNKKEKADTEKVVTDTVLIQYQNNMITRNQLLAALGYERVEGGDIFANDPSNKETSVGLAYKMEVGKLTALQAICADPGIGEEAKKNILQIVFGVTPEQAGLMTIAPPPPKIDPNMQSNEFNTKPKKESAAI